MATLSDVAARAGVSVSAVSRVLSNDPASRVSDETRDRIRLAATEVGYRPNFAGRALKLARTEVLALVVPDVTNALFAELTRGVEDAAISRGYTVLLGRSEDMQPGGVMFDRLLGEGRVDGVILQPRDGQDLVELAGILTHEAPVVTIHERVEATSSVLIPDADASRIAVDHLVELGHTRIGFIGGLSNSSTARRRAEGYREALAAAGGTLDPDLITWIGYRPEDGRAALDQLLDLAAPPTAVVVANVNAAIGVLAQARARNLRVPEDLSVVAIHDAWTAEHTWPPLSCVRMPLYELGRTAVGALVSAIAGGEEQHLLIETPQPRLVIRASTSAV